MTYGFATWSAFVTPVTPFTARVISSARARSIDVGTTPVSVTIPFAVATLTRVRFEAFSAVSFALTVVVIVASSMFRPADSPVIDRQAAATVSTTHNKTIDLKPLILSPSSRLKVAESVRLRNNYPSCHPDCHDSGGCMPCAETMTAMIRKYVKSSRATQFDVIVSSHHPPTTQVLG
jgi:hypothetical protein